MASRSYRSPIDIIVALLRTCQEGGSKRSVLYRSLIDYRPGTKYINILEGKDLIDGSAGDNLLYRYLSRDKKAPKRSHSGNPVRRKRRRLIDK